MFNDFKVKGLVRTGAAPAGTFVFFQATGANAQSGHVAGSDGRGGRITTVGNGGSQIGPIAVKPLSFAGAPYVGWSYAPAGRTW